MKSNTNKNKLWTNTPWRKHKQIKRMKNGNKQQIKYGKHEKWNVIQPKNNK